MELMSPLISSNTGRGRLSAIRGYMHDQGPIRDFVHTAGAASTSIRVMEIVMRFPCMALSLDDREDMQSKSECENERR